MANMLEIRFPVDVLMQCVPLQSRWANERWQPLAVLPVHGSEQDAALPPVCVGRDEHGATWRYTGLTIEMHRTEAEGYFLNLSAPNPVAFVMWRACEDGVHPPVRPAHVTVSYNEAARMLDGGEQVEPVPLPSEIEAWLRPFVQQHYRPEPRRKVRRNDPLAADAESAGRKADGHG
jgi:hypothetical protein